MTRFALLVLLALPAWLVPAPAKAVIPVEDLLNFGANEVTSLQSTITAVQSVLQVANQVLELTGLEGLQIYGSVAEDLVLLQQMSKDANGLVGDLAVIRQQVQLLFDLTTAPDTSYKLQERLTQIRMLKSDLYAKTLAVQTLFQASLSAFQHAGYLLESINVMVGNQQSNQTIAQWQARLSTDFAKYKEEAAAFQRAEVIDRLEAPLIQQSITLINANVMRDWPR